MKSGFSLIEISIVLLISSMMSLSLYTLLNQSRKGVTSISQMIDVSSPLMNFYVQLEKDVTAMFIPNSTEKFYIDESKKKQQKDTKSDDKNLDRPEGEKTSDSTKKEPEKPKHVENLCFIEKTDNSLFWSFITTSGISNLAIDKEKKPIIEPRAYIARVAYVLKKDPTNPELYKLFYKYSNNLDLNNIKKDSFKPSYEILSRIKKMDISFAINIKKSDDKKENSSSKISKIEEPWVEKNMLEKYKALIPAFVHIALELVDESESIYNFNIDLPIYSYHNIDIQENKKPAETKNKNTSQNIKTKPV